MIVFERKSGLTGQDRQRIADTRSKLNENRLQGVLEAQEPVFSPNDKAALIVQPVQPGEGVGDRFEEGVQSIRDRAGGSENGLDVKVTGAAGYSLDAEESALEGCCFGAPIQDASGAVYAALSLSMPKSRMKPAALRPRVIAAVRRAADRISSAK